MPPISLTVNSMPADVWTPSTSTVTPSDGSVTQHHNSATRNGVFVQPTLTPDKAATMGRSAHARVVATGTWDHVIERIALHLGDEAARPGGA